MDRASPFGTLTLSFVTRGKGDIQGQVRNNVLFSKDG